MHTNGHISGLGGGGSDTYAQIVNFTDSGPGGITFASDGTLGGLNLQGAPNDTLDYTSATTGVTFLVPAGTVNGLTGGPDQFSGFGRFLGSASGGNTFIPGPNGGQTFIGSGSTDTINAAGLPAGAVVHTNGHISGLGGGGSDTYAQIVNFTDSGPGGITFASDGTLGGLNLQGAPNDTLDYTSATTGVTFLVPAGTVNGLTGGPDQFSGFGRFLGSASGGNTFIPGPNGGQTFIGSGSTDTINAAGLPAGAVVHTNGHISGLGGGGSDTYAQIVNFTDSGPGGITFASDGTLGGLNLQGAPNDTLDYTSATTGVTFLVPAGTVNGLTGGPDQFSGFGRFLGSASGGNTFIPGPNGGQTFIGAPGSSPPDVLDLTATSSGRVVTLNGDSLASPGTVTGLSGGGSDGFAFIDVFVPANLVPTTTAASFGSGPFVYNGSPFTATATVSPGGGAATISYSGDCTNVGSTCTAKASYPGDTTHQPSTSAPVSITIEPAPVTATAGSGTSTYDGSAKTPPACTITGTYTGDLTCANDPATVGADAGTTTIIPVISGTGLANFAIDSTPGSYTIKPAPTTTTVTFGAGPFVYDGSAFTATATVSPSATGTATIAYSGDCTNAGNTCTATATYAGTAEYLGSSDTVTITIDPAPVKATAGNGTATYDGTAKTPPACVVTGSYTGDLTCTNGPASVGPDVGTTTITPTTNGTDLADFAITPVNGSYTIAPAQVTATGGSGSATYDGTAKTPPPCKVTGTFTGNLTCANNPSSAGPNAGTTTITPVTSGSHLGNFTITPLNGSYTIAPAPTTTTVTFGAGPFIFNGAPFTATATVAPSTAGTATITYSGDCTNPATTCTATASYPGSANYQASSATGSITIAPEYYVCTTQQGQGGNAGNNGNGVIVVRVSICNIHGANVGSSTLTVRAVGLSPTGTPTSPGNSNPGNLFRLTGNAYAYNLDTKPLTPGNYTLNFTVGSDPTVNHYAFTISS